MKEAEMEQIASLIKQVVSRPQDEASIQEVENPELTSHFPIP